MVPQLSAGALTRIVNGENVDKPVVQIMGYKKIPGDSDRYRFLLSDGVKSYNFAMSMSQLSNRLMNGEFEKHAIVQLTQYNVHSQSDKKLIILLDMTVLASAEAVGGRIGNPTLLNSGSSNAPSQSHLSSQTQMNIGSQIGQKYSTPTKNDDDEVEQKYRPPGPQPSTSDAVNRPVLTSPVVNVHPISTLTPYQNKWTIKARVTNKTPIKTWNNSRGEGKLFSMDLLDESGAIRATAFNEQCDKFYDSIEVNQIYYISKARLKPANKNFTSIKNDFEMSFASETTVVLCNGDINNFPTLQFDFTPIARIQDVDKDQLIDVMGICKSSTDVHTIIVRSNNRECKKRDVTLVDKSCADINLTLWGSEAEKFNGSTNQVVVVKGARVSDFGGRSLSTINSSVVQVNPDIREAHLLQGWYVREGAAMETQSVTVKGNAAGANTNWKTFAQVKVENPHYAEKDFFSAKATVVMVKRDNCLYQACPQDDCKKKVVDLQNGLYRCEKCSREFDNFKWRLFLSVNLADFSESLWATCFQETAEAILGTSAEELGRLKEKDEDRYNEIINNANFKSYIFNLRTSMETYNDESRLKTVVYSANPVNSIQYGKKLLIDIQNLEEIL